MITKKRLFRPLILSRHPSHDILRSKHKNIRLFPFKSIVRFGSTTEIDDNYKYIEINTIQSIKNSSNKLLMKLKFEEAEVKNADWEISTNINDLNLFLLNNKIIVAKHHYGSKGSGNTLIKSLEEFNDFIIDKNLNNYIFERYYNYALEYRLHVTENGCFYTCRKALRKDCPEDLKWRHHDDTCVWLLEENLEFRKPNSWNEIENDCVMALKSIGADILSFDVKVQSEVDKNGNKREFQEYILLECNSASSMDNGSGEISICAQKYIDIIPKLIINKYKKNKNGL